MNMTIEFSYEKLGEAIRLLRIKRELKQSYVARKAGMSQPNYCKMEKGTRHVSLGKFLTVCNALEVSPLFLFFCAGYKKMYGRDRIPEDKILKAVLSQMDNEGSKLIKLKTGGG